MKFTINWLKQYINFDLSSTELADKLTMLGLEVDAVENLFHDMDKVVVAKILNVSKHPNADKLVLCEVQAGTEEFNIVCGAPNAKAGMKTALALPGAVMPNGMKIKKAKIRGVESIGMLCSEKDLGISDGQQGIMELPDSFVIGDLLSDALQLSDTLIEVDLTPNRPDCTCVIGVAREIAGVTGGSLCKPQQGELPTLTGDVPFSVEVKDADACPRYAARLLKGVKIAPSPWWLKRILLAVGLRPINNIVDITNFVMLEYGQPLHAFDFNKLSGGKIIVRNAFEGEKITTLDGVERSLTPEMLLICDAENSVAIAGVMGGENSEVSDATQDVLLESAYFNPLSVRKTSRTLGLATDASYRFERGIDPQGTITALERAAQLMVEIAGAQLVENGVDCNAGIKAPAPINIRASKTNDLLGLSLSIKDISNYLNAIEIKTDQIDSDTLKAFPPSFRVDLEREVDLVEEIARLKGFNEIPSSMPSVPMSFSEQDKSREIKKQISNIMTSLGLHEAINYSFTAENHFDRLGFDSDHSLRKCVKILNPLTDDQGIMRSLLLPGLLTNVRHNLNRQNNDIGLFEIGKVFHQKDDQELPDEVLHLGAVFSGRRNPDAPVLFYGSFPIDINSLKGVAEIITNELRLSNVTYQPTNEAPEYADPSLYVSIMHNGSSIGSYCRLLPAVLKEFNIKQDVYYLDIDLEKVNCIEPAQINFTPLSRFPSVKWDLAIIVPESVRAGEMLESILKIKDDILKNVEIFDVYRGNPIKDGFKSIALSVTYHSDKQTLDDDTVGKVHEQIIAMLVENFNGQLREV